MGNRLRFNTERAPVIPGAFIVRRACPILAGVSSEHRETLHNIQARQEEDCLESRSENH